MQVKSIYFDANFYYNIANQKTDPKTLVAFRDFVDQNNIKLCYSPIAFQEVARHINHSERKEFEDYKKILLVMKEWSDDNFLLYPDNVLSRILRLPPRETNKESDLNKFRNMVCSKNTYRELTSEHNFRAFKLLIQTQNNQKKKWQKGVNKFLILKKHEKIKDLTKVDFKKSCLDASIYKATNISNNGFIGVPTDLVTEQLINRIDAYYTAYKTIAHRIIYCNYKVDLNDFDDVHYLIYLGLNENIRFITYDGGIMSKIRGSLQEKQVSTIEKLLSE